MVIAVLRGAPRVFLAEKVVRHVPGIHVFPLRGVNVGTREMTQRDYSHALPISSDLAKARGAEDRQRYRFLGQKGY